MPISLETLSDLSLQSMLERIDSTVEFRLFSERNRPTLTVPEQIAAQIGDQIISGDMAPGTHVLELPLSDRYHVSRGPIRDAFRILEREGLLTIEPRRGAKVTALSAQELAEIFEIRAGLLAIVARKNALERNPAFIRVYEHYVARLKQYAVKKDEGVLYAETSYRLSLSSAIFAGNQRMREIITSLSLQTLRYSKLGFRSVAQRQRSLKLWQEGAEALKAGDADRMAAISAQRVHDSGTAAAAALKQL
jgi:DNA-binding GntR family transcriptional regulator